MLRYKDINNYYLFIYEKGRLMITKKTAGSIVELASVAYSMTLNTWYSFMAIIQGNTLIFKVNNTQMLTATDTDHVSGKCGYIAFNTTSYIDDFTITGGGVPPTSPKITGFNPVKGPIGTSVNIQGENLLGASEVVFGIGSTTPISVSATQIIAVVPNGASTGPIKVIVGSQSAISATSFTVESQPATNGPIITGLVPSAGKIDDQIVIQGINLDNITQVKVKGVNASFEVKNAYITTTVPPEATTGKIEVMSYAISSKQFTVDDAPPPPVKPTITGYSPTSGKVGSQVNITGTNLHLITEVKIGGSTVSYTGVSALITANVPQLGVGLHAIVLSYAQQNLAVGNFEVIDVPPSEGKILYHFNAKNGQGILKLENDQNTSWAYRIENDPVLGRPAYRFECRSAFSGGDSQRSELKIYRKDWHADMNKTYFYGFQMMLDPGWKISGDRYLVFCQMHDIPDGIDTQQLEAWRHPTLAFCAINDKWKITYRVDTDKISDTSDWSKFDSKTLAYPKNAYGWQGHINQDEPNWHAFPLTDDIGKWTKWVVKVKWSYTEKVLEVWKNGVKLISEPHHPISYNDNLGPSSKLGIYRSSPHSFAPYQDRILWYRDYIVGDENCNYDQIMALMN
jgi:hypothetical protein